MTTTVRATLAVAALAAALGLTACGGSSEDAPDATPPPAAEPPAATEPRAPATTGEAKGPESAVTTEAELEPGLPEDIAGYQSWIVLNAAPIPPNEQGDAHLGTKNVYASEEAGPDGVYPDGAIIVKDATRPDADFVGLVAIMEKSAGFDPEHADWKFVEYTREAPDEPFVAIAADAVCWSCHVGAAETDYVWVATLGLTK